MGPTRTVRLHVTSTAVAPWQELETTFTGWEVIADNAAGTSCMSASVKRTAPHFFRLRRDI